MDTAQIVYLLVELRPSRQAESHDRAAEPMSRR